MSIIPNVRKIIDKLYFEIQPTIKSMMQKQMTRIMLIVEFTVERSSDEM